MKLPAALSASLREGATRLAMMGDQSQSKRGDVELKIFSPCRQSSSNSEGSVLDLALLPGRRLTIWRGIAQGGVTDARHLVGQRTGRLVVIGAGLHRRRPLDAQSVQPARPMGRTAGFHDDQRDIPVLKPALELAARKAMRFDDFPGRVGDGQLEDAFCKIDGNGSSIHFGFLLGVDRC